MMIVKVLTLCASRLGALSVLPVEEARIVPSLMTY